MQTYHVKLESEIFKSFRCQRAADSLDIDIAKKSIHELNISADLQSPFSVGLILGASGSGKTTLAHQIFGPDCFKTYLDPDKPIIEQLPSELSYDNCASILAGIGLTSVPCWIRPLKTLSNGQKARAEAALAMTRSTDMTVIDEWTSVVDRTVAKVMSHCVQKFARNQKKKIVLLSCHYDVVEWLDPDWIIDCNKQQYIDRRLLPAKERKRKEQLNFDIREIDRSTWKYFSKYHYLSERLAGGQNFLFGLFQNQTQIGFIAFSSYVPHDHSIFHFNRLVIHPDFCGLGLGVHFLNATASYMRDKYRKRIMGKFSSIPTFKSLMKSPNWKLRKSRVTIGGQNIKMNRYDSTWRTNLRTFNFEFI